MGVIAQAVTVAAAVGARKKMMTMSMKHLWSTLDALGHSEPIVINPNHPRIKKQALCDPNHPILGNPKARRKRAPKAKAKLKKKLCAIQIIQYSEIQKQGESEHQKQRQS